MLLRFFPLSFCFQQFVSEHRLFYLFFFFEHRFFEFILFRCVELLKSLGIDFKISIEAMAPHSSTLAWKIPWTEDPGRLQSMGSLRVGHDSVTSL